MINKEDFELLRLDAKQILKYIDIAEGEGAMAWADYLGDIARIANSLSASAKEFADRERKMNWRPVGSTVRKHRR